MIRKSYKILLLSGRIDKQPGGPTKWDDVANLCLLSGLVWFGNQVNNQWERRSLYLHNRILVGRNHRMWISCSFHLSASYNRASKNSCPYGKQTNYTPVYFHSHWALAGRHNYCLDFLVSASEDTSPHIWKGSLGAGPWIGQFHSSSFQTCPSPQSDRSCLAVPVIGTFLEKGFGSFSMLVRNWQIFQQNSLWLYTHSSKLGPPLVVSLSYKWI